MARRPFSNPAAPRRKAPMQTEVTYWARALCLRTKSTVSSSAIAPTTPGPPGTQMTSSCGQDSKTQVGMIPRPRSLRTGCIDLAAMCVRECANALGAERDGGVPKRLKTSNGPVKSNCVMSGKITKPTLKSDMALLLRTDRPCAHHRVGGGVPEGRSDAPTRQASR